MGLLVLSRVVEGNVNFCLKWRKEWDGDVLSEMEQGMRWDVYHCRKLNLCVPFLELVDEGKSILYSKTSNAIGYENASVVVESCHV